MVCCADLDYLDDEIFRIRIPVVDKITCNFSVIKFDKDFDSFSDKTDKLYFRTAVANWVQTGQFLDYDKFCLLNIQDKKL